MSVLVPALAAAAQWAPMVTSLTPLRRAVLPSLAGRSVLDHVALTFDDGPDPESTPRFLELLERHGVTATFFLVGQAAARHPEMVRELSDQGHELGVHGWDHTCLIRKRPGVVVAELRRTAALLEDLSGSRVRWFRPPYGVMTGDGLVAAHRARLRTVLWSSWGRDWTREATPQTICDTVTRSLRPGGTVLLHDTDRMAAPRSWVNTLGASGQLLDAWAEDGWAVGPLRQHW